MFKQNKYTQIYYQIIEKRQRVKPTDVYTEDHHIIPRSLGGGNGKNIITLTSREHFVCHLLLPKMLLDNHHRRKMIHAAFMMCHISTHKQCRYQRISSKAYESLRGEFAKSCAQRTKDRWAIMSDSEYNTVCAKMKESANLPDVVVKKKHIGKANGMHGRKHSDEVKHRISKANKGRFKGKSYIDIHGEEKAQYLKHIRSIDMKKIRSTQDLTGANNPNAKPVSIRGIQFKTSADAATYFNKSRPTICGWIKRYHDCYYV